MSLADDLTPAEVAEGMAKLLPGFHPATHPAFHASMLAENPTMAVAAERWVAHCRDLAAGRASSTRPSEPAGDAFESAVRRGRDAGLSVRAAYSRAVAKYPRAYAAHVAAPTN